MRQERFHPRFNTVNLHHNSYHHRHLKLNDDIPLVQKLQKPTRHDSSKFFRDFPKDFSWRKKRKPYTNARQLPIERQAGVVGLLSGNPAGAGLAWFASLVGLAAMAREPLTSVLNGVTSWNQLFNGTYLFNKIKSFQSNIISRNSTIVLIPRLIEFIFLGTASTRSCPDNASKNHVYTLRWYIVKE